MLAFLYIIRFAKKLPYNICNEFFVCSFHWGNTPLFTTVINCVKLVNKLQQGFVCCTIIFIFLFNLLQFNLLMTGCHTKCVYVAGYS